MAGSKTHEIVILGGNFGGVGEAHYLLRHTIPALQKLDSSRKYHITLVTPNKDWLFKPAAPRVLIAPSLLPEEKVWRPLTDIFKRYPADQISLVHGVATNLDSSKKTVTVKLNAPGGEHTVPYDSLVLATGTTSTHPAWTIHNDQSETSKAFKSMQEVIPRAKTVIIAGGGAVGIETAGEIGVAFPKAEVTLYSGAPKLLEKITNPKLGPQAETYLKNNLGVKVVHNVKVTASSGSGPTTVTLSDGTTQTVDLYIDCTGGKANSGYLPSSWLDVSGRVIKKDEYFRVKGTGDDAKDVYVLGDLVAGSDNSIFQLEAHVPTVGSAIGQDIAEKIGKKGKAPPLKEYKPLKGIMMIPIGPNGGVGQAFGYTVPSFMVKFAKAKTFLIDLLEPYAYGDKWKKP